MSNHLTPISYEYMGHPLVVCFKAPPCGCKVYTCAEDIKRDHIMRKIVSGQSVYVTAELQCELISMNNSWGMPACRQVIND